jgi:hypothetical protein
MDSLQIVELALLDLLPNDVNIQGEIYLLDGFDREPRKQADDHSDQQDSPEGQTTVDFCSGLVELIACNEGRIYASPEPDEERADDDNSDHDPVPTVSIEQDVEIGSADRNGGDEDTHTFKFVETKTIGGVECSW